MVVRQARRAARMQAERDEVDQNMRILAEQEALREPDYPELAASDNSRWFQPGGYPVALD